MLPSDPTAFKIPQVPSSILTVLRLHRQSFGILNAVEFSVALSNYYIIYLFIYLFIYLSFMLSQATNNTEPIISKQSRAN